jgi:hypothetical protein
MPIVVVHSLGGYLRSGVVDRSSANPEECRFKDSRQDLYILSVIRLRAVIDYLALINLNSNLQMGLIFVHVFVVPCSHRKRKRLHNKVIDFLFMVRVLVSHALKLFSRFG